jgi:hypothetical protein
MADKLQAESLMWQADRPEESVVGATVTWQVDRTEELVT